MHPTNKNNVILTGLVRRADKDSDGNYNLIVVTSRPKSNDIFLHQVRVSPEDPAIKDKMDEILKVSEPFRVACDYNLAHKDNKDDLKDVSSMEKVIVTVKGQLPCATIAKPQTPETNQILVKDNVSYRTTTELLKTADEENRIELQGQLFKTAYFSGNIAMTCIDVSKDNEEPYPVIIEISQNNLPGEYAKLLDKAYPLGQTFSINGTLATTRYGKETIMISASCNQIKALDLSQKEKRKTGIARGI